MSLRMQWPYTRRLDGRIAVTLDNNIWNFLCDNAVDLPSEFPLDRFALFIPREVEIEAQAIPGKADLREYIDRSMERAKVVTTATIGFDTGEAPVRVAPFGYGTFQSPLEAEVYEALRIYFRPRQKASGLYVNEGDAAVAVASLASVVLTMEKPRTPGPLRFVGERGGKIIHLYGRSSVAPLEVRALVMDCFALQG
jgi:hypothetical protein